MGILSPSAWDCAKSEWDNNPFSTSSQRDLCLLFTPAEHPSESGSNPNNIYDLQSPLWSGLWSCLLPHPPLSPSVILHSHSGLRSLNKSSLFPPQGLCMYWLFCWDCFPQLVAWPGTYHLKCHFLSEVLPDYPTQAVPGSPFYSPVNFPYNSPHWLELFYLLVRLHLSFSPLVQTAWHIVRVQEIFVKSTN